MAVEHAVTVMEGCFCLASDSLYGRLLYLKDV